MASRKHIPPSKKGALKKQVRIPPGIKDTLSQKPAWQFGLIDLEGPYGWADVGKNVLTKDILPKLTNFETMYWRDILGRNNHEIGLEKLCKDARDRLTQLKLDDFEALVSLRLTGPKRLWGIKIGNVLKILWFDPEHQVCPSSLKHT